MSVFLADSVLSLQVLLVLAMLCGGAALLAPGLKLMKQIHPPWPPVLLVSGILLAVCVALLLLARRISPLF